MCRETTPHLRSGSVESDVCYRHVCASGAKVSVLDVVFGLTFVQSNLHDEPISYIELAFIINSFGRANGCLHLAIFLRYT